MVNNVALSGAWSRLLQRLAEVRLLLAFCSDIEADPTIRRLATSQDAALLRGALVLLCSHLEGYFEDLVSDALSAFDHLAPTVVSIPAAIRYRQIAHKLQSETTGDLRRQWPAFQACLAHPLMRDDDTCEPGKRNIDPELHTVGFANPGTGEIAQLMKTIGIDDCWSPIEAIVGKAKKSTVDAVVNRRNQIAHGDLESSVSRIDAERYVEYVQDVCREFDRLVSQHITAQTGNSSPWSISNG